MMNFLTRLSVRNRWLTLILTTLVILASILAIGNMKMELIPDIEFPIISVVTVYPGAPPALVADEITAPIESAIAEAGDFKEITSTSSRNVSFIMVQYDFGTDMDEVASEISQSLAGLTLPTGAQPPQFFPMSMDIMPLVALSLAGDISTVELRGIAISQVVPRLEAVEGVYAVEVVGGEEQVIIALDIGRMNQAGISPSQVAGTLGAYQYSSLDEIENTPLAMSQLTVKDIAGVALGPALGTAITNTNGQPSVSIVVTKDPEANMVEVANAVVAEAESIKEILSNNVELITVLDQSDFIERAIGDLYREAIIGAILAVVAIFLFLLAFRASLVTAISIPLSVLIGFLAMWLWGITINLLTLTAMALAVGRVVDDAIVVLEVIYRHLKRGEGFKEAAINGAREVATPITSATIATVVVFIPLALVGGMVGELFLPFALTVIFALLASLLVALTVVPALSGFISPKEIKKEAEAESRGTWYQRAYKPVLKWALGHRAITLLITAALVTGSFALLPIIGTSFLPTTSEKMVMVEIEMPLGTDLETTAEMAGQVERIIADSLSWKIYETTVGTSTAFGGFSPMGGGGGSNSAFIMVILQSDADLETEAALLQGLVQPLEGEGKITVSAGMEGGMPGMSSSSLVITITGQDSQSVAGAADEIITVLEDISGLADIESDVIRAIPQPQIQLDPVSVMEHGLDLGELNMELGLLMTGAPVSQLNLNGDVYEVFMAPPMQQVGSLEQLREMRIGLTDTVALSDIAAVSFELESTQIHRADQKPAVQITAAITEKDVGAVNLEVEDRINALSLAPGVGISMGGVFEDMTEGFGQMGIAIIVAIFIAYLVLVVTFRSFLNPFIIMFSLPVATIGALLGLLVTGHTLGISALMGLLMLVGIVLTNAIVLIALVDQLRRKGLSAYDALIEGGNIRLRPILMTMTATSFAMFPLALGFGEGTVIAAELATVVIGGLFTSTLLTLVVVPVIYSLFDGLRRRVARG